jgi:2'-5' RNA ligase
VEEYRTARSEEKRVHKQKKKIFIGRVLEELERLRSNNESKSFYQKINKSRKDFKPRTILCRNKEGTLLSEEDDILRKWAEHFDELLNKEFFLIKMSLVRKRIKYIQILMNLLQR